MRHHAHLVAILPLLLSVATAVGEPSRIEPGEHEVSLAEGATELRVFRAARDETLALTVRPDGRVRIEVALLSPDGQTAAATTTPTGHPDSLLFLADQEGDWTVRMRTTDGDPVVAWLSLSIFPPASLGPRLPDDAVVAVLDTGIDSRHEEFAEGQLVGWVDLAGDARGNRRAVPYDDHGHGTSSASLAAGHNLGAAPGAKLAVAKVLRADGRGTWADVAEGVRWADSHMRAKVISISIDTRAPLPSAGGLLVADLNAALAAAHANGSLVVVANGNTGTLPGETHPPAWTRHAFAVGAADKDGLVASYSDHDPEVVAWGHHACVARAVGRTGPAAGAACMNGDTRYGVLSGTSFAAPRVAGWALGLAALAPPGEAAPERLEALLRRTAHDRLHVPYAREGYGFLDGASVAEAAAHLHAGTSPAWTAPLLANEAMHEASDAAKRAVGDAPH